jgi:hypothetical protein
MSYAMVRCPLWANHLTRVRALLFQGREHDQCGRVGVRRVVSRAKRASTGGRSALSFRTCDLERDAGARARAGQTRRSLSAVELLPVVAETVVGEAVPVRTLVLDRWPAPGRRWWRDEPGKCPCR